jgi:hypothetical protein
VPLPHAKVLISALAVLIEPILRLKIRPATAIVLFMPKVYADMRFKERV